MNLVKVWILIFSILVISSCKEVSNTPPAQAIERTANLNINNNQIYSLIISKKDDILLEEYYNGNTENSLNDIQSLTKGIISLLIGIAIDKGFIESVEEPISKYIPDNFNGIKDERKKRITIKHILNQNSGLEWKGHLEHETWLKSKDPVKYVLDKPLSNTPGKFYNYNSGATHILSVIISKATNKSTLQFANEVLFEHLKIFEIDWQIRNDQNYDGSGLGLKMRSKDLIKIGQLLLNNGKWNATSLIKPKTVSQLFDEKGKSKTSWGIRNSKHGFCWYKAHFNGDTIDYGMGYGGQFILLVHKKELCIVSTHNTDTPNGIEQQIKFLNRDLPKIISKFGS